MTILRFGWCRAPEGLFRILRIGAEVNEPHIAAAQPPSSVIEAVGDRGIQCPALGLI